MSSKKTLVFEGGGCRDKTIVLIVLLGEVDGLHISSQLGWRYARQYRQVADRCCDERKCLLARQLIPSYLADGIAQLTHTQAYRYHIRDMLCALTLCLAVDRFLGIDCVLIPLLARPQRFLQPLAVYLCELII